jgi:hypothetical protein
MAGEFFVMERLFRLGHEPALTLGNAKSIDIIVKTKSGDLKTVSVKAARGGGKWGVGSRDLSHDPNLIFVFLLYAKFEDPDTDPTVWVMPAAEVQAKKRRWINGWAIFYAHRDAAPKDLAAFRDRWDYLGNCSAATREPWGRPPPTTTKARWPKRAFAFPATRLTGER